MPSIGSIHRAGGTFEAARDDEIEQWLKLDYVQETTSRRKITKKRSTQN